MDLSVFLILIFVTLQFVGEYFGWNQLKVKLGIFIATLIIALPNLIFMVIDWWQDPHSKIALLVLNTFKPILRGETYRLFRWLKTIGISLSSDDLNHLPFSKLNTDNMEAFMTKECFEQTNTTGANRYLRVIPEEIDVDENGVRDVCWLCYTKCTGFRASWCENEGLVVHEFRFSKQLPDLCSKFTNDDDLISHPSVKSRLVRSRAYNNVDIGTARKLLTRLRRICLTEIPILTQYKMKREWNYFNAAPTLENLDSDLVLVRFQGEPVAVG
ncbi:hypothetical protein KC19_7G127600 [Ceratodon purpureus]|uniref:Uncharacterized protein n=1 Tax=Ceratodon purpureus TaxID=3225 RepID=A0A8T0H7H8_CERPU|nr:hypothetical protein KC19_7G127600 [Ceratodon purpureus]KAG0567343.1 hypothetical protein KC19_7G127600 [Ceratodon purpureus]